MRGRNMKKKKKKIALVASFAAFGCNCGIVNTVGLLEGTMSDVLKFGAAVTIVKFASDNFHLKEKGELKLFRTLNQFPKYMEYANVSKELLDKIKKHIEFYNDNKDAEDKKIDDIKEKLSFKKAYELADKIKSKQLYESIDSEAIIELSKKRFFDLSINRESSLTIQGEENKENKEGNENNKNNLK